MSPSVHVRLALRLLFFPESVPILPRLPTIFFLFATAVLPESMFFLVRARLRFPKSKGRTKEYSDRSTGRSLVA